MKNRTCRICSKTKQENEFKKIDKTNYRNECLICFREKERNNRLKRYKISDPERAKRIELERLIKEQRGECPSGCQWCYNCKQYKTLKSFSTTNIKNIGQCRACASEGDIQRARVLKIKAIEYCGSSCNRCGLKNGHFGVYDFHHKTPSEKEMNWNKMRKKSWNNLLPELNKCILLCRNCHGTIHCKINNDGSLNKEYVPSNI